MNFDFNKFFSQFTSTESVGILFFLLLAFLFGIWFHYLTRMRKMRKLRSEIAALQSSLKTAEAETQGWREQISLKEADLKKANFEVEELDAKIDRIEEEKKKLYNEIYVVNAELDKTRAKEKEASLALAELNQRVVDLQQKNVQLAEANQKLTEQLAAIELEPPMVQATQPALESNLQATERLEALETKLSKLETDNHQLHQEIKRILTTQPVSTTSSSTVKTSASPLLHTNDVTIVENPAALFQSEHKLVVAQKVNLDQQPEKDDLTLIEGIGPFIEKKLNDNGIFSYEQISQFTKDQIDQITRKIEYFPGRIEKDNWVGQAARLLLLKTENPDALHKNRRLHAILHDDLKVIEGIGPKIEELLNDADIFSWEQLAEFSEEQLKEILAGGGDRYKLHDPATWPTQARLAANGDWDLLREYQEQLRGGKEVLAD